MSKSIEQRNIRNINKNDFQRRNENFKNISNKLNYIIDYEFLYAFKNILNTPKIDFINSVIIKLRNFLLDEYSKSTFDQELFKNLLTQSKEKLEKICY